MRPSGAERGVVSRLIPEGVFRSPVTVNPLSIHRIDDYLEVMHAGINSLPFRRTRNEDIAKKTAGYYKEALKNLLSEGGEWTLLAAENNEGEIVGVLEGRVVYKGKFGAVFWVCTAPGMQKQGVARALYAAYEAELKAHNKPYMLAGIHDLNKSSQSFHQSYGFNFTTPYDRSEAEHMTWYIKDLG